MARNSENAGKYNSATGQTYERSWAVEWEDLKAFSKRVATGFTRCECSRRWWSQMLRRAERKFCSNTDWPQDSLMGWKGKRRRSRGRNWKSHGERLEVVYNKMTEHRSWNTAPKAQLGWMKEAPVALADFEEEKAGVQRSILQEENCRHKEGRLSEELEGRPWSWTYAEELDRKTWKHNKKCGGWICGEKNWELGQSRLK